MAREHAVSPTSILRRVFVRKVKWLRTRALQLLGLDKPKILPHAATAIWLWRKQRGRTPRADTPDALLPVATGTLAELSIAGVCPAVTCFLQLDLPTLVLRWSPLSEHCLFLQTVEDLRLEERPAKHRSRRFSLIPSRLSRPSPPASNRVTSARQEPSGEKQPRRLSLRSFSKKRSHTSWLLMSYRDMQGLSRVLVLTLPSVEAAVWHRVLSNVLVSASTIPASVAHRRWALSCMESVGWHGATGLIRRSDFFALLNRVRDSSYCFSVAHYWTGPCPTETVLCSYPSHNRQT